MAFAAFGLPSKLVAASPLSPIYVTGAGASCAGFPAVLVWRRSCESRRIIDVARCDVNAGRDIRTCRNCKSQFDSVLNHSKACQFHNSHFGGETKRKFESVYIGGSMETPNSGKVFQYWHCCGSEDPFHPGCVAAPHSTYDD